MKKQIILFFGLILASTMMAQVKVGALAPKEEDLQEKGTRVENYTYQVGDTIIIAKETERYLTGERIANWVYYVRHIVEKVGGKRFPNGVLIRGIYSWVEPAGLLLVNPKDMTPEGDQKVSDDQPKVEERQQELAEMSDAEKQAIAKIAQDHNFEMLQEKEATPVVEEEPEDSIMPLAIATAEEVVPEETKAEPVHQQANRFTIGVRGGVASLMHQTENNLGNWKPGFDVMLDLQYAHYWKTDAKPALGILVGLGAGYSRSAMQASVDDKFTRTIGTDVIDYSVTAEKVNEKDGEVILEVPVMFSMITDKGFFLNVGPKVAMPVYSHYNQTITNPNVDAYFVKEGVHVPNELVTGKVTDDLQNTKGKFKAGTINVMLGAELGYEYTFKNRNSLSIGAYADYSVYTLYKNDLNLESLVGVGDPGNGAAKVSVLSATDSYANKLGFFDCGLKLAFHFNWWK